MWLPFRSPDRYQYATKHGEGELCSHAAHDITILLVFLLCDEVGESFVKLGSSVRYSSICTVYKGSKACLLYLHYTLLVFAYLLVFMNSVQLTDLLVSVAGCVGMKYTHI